MQAIIYTKGGGVPQVVDVESMRLYPSINTPNRPIQVIIPGKTESIRVIKQEMDDGEVFITE